MPFLSSATQLFCEEIPCQCLSYLENKQHNFVTAGNLMTLSLTLIALCMDTCANPFEVIEGML